MSGTHFCFVRGDVTFPVAPPPIRLFDDLVPARHCEGVSIGTIRVRYHKLTLLDSFGIQRRTVATPRVDGRVSLSFHDAQVLAVLKDMHCAADGVNAAVSGFPRHELKQALRGRRCGNEGHCEGKQKKSEDHGE